MPKFTVEQETAHAPDQAFAKIKGFLGNAGEIQKFDSKAQVTFDDASKSARINGSQFKADMKIQPAGTGSKIAITVDLPLLLSPFKGKVQETLQKMLTKHLA